MEPAFDDKWFFGQGSWAKIEDSTIAILSEYMKNFSSSHQDQINQAGIETSKKFTWSNTVQEIIKYV